MSDHSSSSSSSNTVDMDRVYDDVLRIADEYNHKLASFTMLLGGGFTMWALLLGMTATTGHTFAFQTLLMIPLLLLVPLIVACHHGELVWRAPTGENIVQHSTDTALCAAVCSHRPLLIAVLVSKEEGLWPQILEVTRKATVTQATLDGRRIFAMNKLVSESVRQMSLRD